MTSALINPLSISVCIFPAAFGELVPLFTDHALTSSEAVVKNEISVPEQKQAPPVVNVTNEVQTPEVNIENKIEQGKRTTKVKRDSTGKITGMETE